MAGLRHVGVVRPRSQITTTLGAAGAADGDMELELGGGEAGEDNPELVKEFYSEV